MNQEWSLDVLYHGYEDPKFDEDMKKFESEVAGMNKDFCKVPFPAKILFAVYIFLWFFQHVFNVFPLNQS